MDKEDVGCVYNGTLLSHKKEWNNTICRNMPALRDYNSESSKKEKDKYHMITCICGI